MMDEESENNKICQDYDEAVELTGNGRYNYLLLATCSLISTAVAFDLFGFGLIVAASSCDLHLTMQQKGLLSSVPFAGALFAFPWGYLADLRGRRLALIWSTSVGFIFSSLGSLSSQWYILLSLKFIGCIFSVASISLTMTYLGECIGSRHRGQYLQIMNSFNLTAEALYFCMALFILPLKFNIPIPWLSITYRPWRLLTLLMATPLGMGAVLMMFLYESPKFLANIGKEKKALKILAAIFERNGGQKCGYPVKIIKTVDNRENNNTSCCNSILKQTLPIFKMPLLPKTIQMFYLILLMCSTNNVFVMWFPTMVNSFFISVSGSKYDESFCDRVTDNVTTITDSNDNVVSCDDVVSDATIFSGIGYGVFFGILNLSMSKLSHRRRLVLFITFGVSFISCILVEIVNQPILNFISFVLLQGTSVGIGIAASYFNEMFPTSYRALATSLGMMVGRLGSFAGVNLIGLIFNDYCSLTFYCWSIFVLSGIFVTLLLPPDSKENRIVKK